MRVNQRTLLWPLYCWSFEKLDELLSYLEENWAGIYGSRRLKGRVAAKEVLVVGSGGVEREMALYSAAASKAGE